MSYIARVTQQRSAIKEGLKIVRKVVAGTPTLDGFTTAELYRLALKEEPSADFVKYETAPVKPPSTRGKERVAPPTPPHPEHPIRSIAFLKQKVLPIMESSKEIKTVRVTRTQTQLPPTLKPSGQIGKARSEAQADTVTPTPATVWVWKAVPNHLRPKPKTRDIVEPRFGSEVGAGEDWSHLNKRRRKARAGKVYRDIGIMKLVNEQRAVKMAGGEHSNQNGLLKKRGNTAVLMGDTDGLREVSSHPVS